MNSSTQIQEMVSKLIKELLDKRTIKKLGTSVEQHMSRDYQKTIEEKFIQLKNEFNSMDYNDDSLLSVDEIYNFFSSKNPNVKKEDIQTLFELSDTDKNKRLSINEFVYIYVLLEEKLKMKKISLSEVKDSLQAKLAQYQNKLKDYENEEYNSNGISNESELKITIIEITNLKSLLIAPKCKVVLNLMDKSGQVLNEKETQLITGTSNPKFNEKFVFKIEDYNNYVKCMIFDSDALISEGQGSFIINLTNLFDQLTHDLWLDVIGGQEGCKVHVSCLFIYNNTKRYKDLISKTTQQMDRLSQNIFQIENLEEKLNQPYGLIMFNKIKEILDKKILSNSENVSEYLGTSRISVYTDQRNTKLSYSESPNNKYSPFIKDEEMRRTKIEETGLGMIPEENLINSNLLRDEVTSTEGFLPDLGPLNQYFPKNSSFLGKKSNQLIILGVIITILAFLFGKIDIYNLVLFVFGFLMIYNMFRINNRLNTKRYFFYGLLAGILFDTIWIIILNRDQNQSSTFRVIVFGLTIFSLVIKIILSYLIKNRRR